MRWKIVALRRPEDESGSAAQTSSDQSQEAIEAFKFDPSNFFVPPAKEGSGGDEGGDQGQQSSSAVPDPGKDPADGAASPAGSPPPPPPSEPAKKEGEDDPLAALRASVQELLSKPMAAPKAEEAPPAPRQEAPKPEAKPEQAQYNFTVPSDLVEGLSAEEPSTRHRAVNSLVNGIANQLAKDFGSAMAAMAQEVQKRAVEAAVSHMEGRNSEKTVRQDFYDTFKDVKELVDQLPALDAVVWDTAQKVAAARGAKGWTPQLRDEVGTMLRLQLRLPAAASGGAPAPTGGAPAPRKAPYNAGGGGGGRPNGRDDQNEFLAVVNAGAT